MGVAVFISLAILLAMLALAIYMSLDWDPEKRTIGLCTAAWVAIAVYLFLSQWLFMKKHELYSLATITLLGTAGYVVGKTLVAITRRDSSEERAPALSWLKKLTEK
jgi:hypothetical protein